MQGLIKVINKLQDTFATLNTTCPIELPQIAVVGEQSAGKSSVLENFVGKDFLPRGSGIVTRRPLVLQLINQSGPEYGEFLHQPGRKYTDFLEVRNEIEAETNRVTGNNKNISPIPINLRIFSPHVANITLIDLPGLTKVPVGDQPKDIDKQIRDMILIFISNPKCLILTVTPAIMDLANSEALKLASDVDPDGMRTIGVITKIDMMDQGTNCKDVLENRVYPLRRGYIGVVNRSQQDINVKKNIKSAQEAEMKFFMSHPIYRSMKDRLGSACLQNSLSQQLAMHIKESLPSLREAVVEQIRSLEQSFGGNINNFKESTASDKAKLLMNGIQEFSKNVDTVLGYQQECVDTTELSGGSIINKILYQRFQYELDKVKKDNSIMKKEIKMAIQNSQGVRSTIFTPDVAFTAVVRKHIEDTRPCCNKIAELVIEEVRRIIEKSCAQQFADYPAVMAEIVPFCNQGLSAFLVDAKNKINFIIDAELTHINTRHPDFIRQIPGMEDSSSTSENSACSVPRTTGITENTVFKKGMIQLASQNIVQVKRSYFCVLRGSTMILYKDDMEKEIKNHILIDGCRIKDYATGYSSKKNCFQLYNKDGKAISKELKSLDIVCSTNEDAEDWKAAFMAAGVVTDRNIETENINSSNNNDQAQIHNDTEDLNLCRQMEYIFMLVDNYLKIIIKNEIDIVAKICIYCIISKMRKFLTTEVMAHLYSKENINNLMRESEDVIIKRKEIRDLYRSCQQALTIIDDFSSKPFSSYDTKSETPYTSHSNPQLNFNDDMDHAEMGDSYSSDNNTVFMDAYNSGSQEALRRKGSFGNGVNNSFNQKSESISNVKVNRRVLPTSPQKAIPTPGKPQRPPPKI